MKTQLPTVTTKQMRDLDRFMTHKMGIPILVMMEHAGLYTARLARDMLKNKKKVLVLTGSGHNGGDGLATARHLANWGYHPTVIHLKGKSTKKAVKKQSYMLRQMKLPVTEYKPEDHKAFEKLIGETDLIVDALIGYNLISKLKPPAQTIINSVNQSGKPVLAIDGPSGLNFDTGQPQPVAIKATTTLALSLPKTGLITNDAEPYVGTLLVAYMSVPKEVYMKLGLSLPTQFAKKQILKHT